MRVRFVGSFKKDFPKGDGRKHVVFAGRSNVGKSSLINMMVGQDVARVSKEPGRTRSVNFFLIEDYHVYLVDLPGYGFAKVSKEEREGWRTMIEDYFKSCWEDIRVVFLLIDSLVGPTELDVKAIEWFEGLRLPYMIVLTKCDRATQKDIHQAVEKVKEVSQAALIKTSFKEGRGKKELLRYALG